MTTEIIYDNAGVMHIIRYETGNMEARKEAIADLRNK